MRYSDYHEPMPDDDRWLRRIEAGALVIIYVSAAVAIFYAIVWGLPE